MSPTLKQLERIVLNLIPRYNISLIIQFSINRTDIEDCSNSVSPEESAFPTLRATRWTRAPIPLEMPGLM
jgi:hypothetical protein